MTSNPPLPRTQGWGNHGFRLYPKGGPASRGERGMISGMIRPLRREKQGRLPSRACGEVLFVEQDRWCPGRESNPHVPLRTRDFKSRASANFATRAGALSALYRTCGRELFRGG